MKHLHSIALIIAFVGTANLVFAQAEQSDDKQKVVIIKKSVDQDGNVTIEKEVTVGDVMDAEYGDGEVIERNLDVTVNAEDGHRIIRIDHNGETEVIELEEGEEIPEEIKQRLQEKGILITGEEGGVIIGKDDNKMQKVIIHKAGDHDFDFDFDINLDGLGEGIVHLSKDLAKLGDNEWRHVTWNVREEINCAALGVYVSSNDPSGVLVSNTIGSSGAEEAGMQRGDVITFIDEYPTTTYRELHEALAHYEPGDVVAVTFTRDGKENRVEAQLRAWKDLPSFANRQHALVNCDGEVSEEVVSRKIIVIKKDREEAVDDTPMNVNQSPQFNSTLELQDFSAFPNPTDGKFNVRFEAEAVPTVVSIFDAAGKEIFRDNLENFPGFYTKEVDLTNHAKGGIVLSVEQGGKVFTDQIILN